MARASVLIDTRRASLSQEHRSAESFTEEICRICRCQDEYKQLIKCPCLCRGSIGNIHLMCLKRWMLYSGESKCEICKASFELPKEALNLKMLTKNLFSLKCTKPIARNLFQIVPLLPLGFNMIYHMLVMADSVEKCDHRLLFAYLALILSRLYHHIYTLCQIELVRYTRCLDIGGRLATLLTSKQLNFKNNATDDRIANLY